MTDLEQAHAAYLTAALWSSINDDGEPLDRDHGIDDIHPDSREASLTEVGGFIAAAHDAGLDVSALDPAQLGHDLWLTRNRHGAGFWDRGLGKLGDDLTTLAHSLGGSDLYIGDDGRLYLEEEMRSA